MLRINTHPIPKGPGSSGRGIIPIKQQELLNRDKSSSAIATLEYDIESMQMKCVFNNRGTFVYYDFPPDVAADWLTAGSRGTYFNLYIRNSGYEYERVA